MVDNKKPGGVKSLAAMFEANISSSQVSTTAKPLARKPTAKIANNPFESSNQAAAANPQTTTAPKPAPKPAAQPKPATTAPVNTAPATSMASAPTP